MYIYMKKRKKEIEKDRQSIERHSMGRGKKKKGGEDI